jgi:hypothetical protein
MNRISVRPPEVSGQVVTFRWCVEPATALYRATQFSLRFPDAVDPTPVPEGIWWIIALACLSPHWPLLRPCRVDLPVTLGPGEAEVWLRLTDAAVATIETLGGSGRLGREIEIVERGPLVPSVRVPESGRCATAFSGGKDSLVQAGLLAELTPRPVLVTTTSPMPPTEDHVTARRRHVMREIAARRDVTHVEVHSDFRAAWVNDFPYRLQYRIAVNELSDALLYFGVLLAVGAALSAPHLFLASEVEVQQNARLDGRIVQHPHFMYSTVTQRVLQALLRPAGMRYGTLTSPLHSYQVQELLWTRYADLRDLQYSCYKVAGDEATCSRCPQCFRMAMTTLGLGDSPAENGVDLVRLFWAMRDWAPKPPEDEAAAVRPSRVTASMLESQTIRAVHATSVGRIIREIGAGRLAGPRSWRAIAAYARMRRRLANVPAEAAPGYRAGYLAAIDPVVKERVAAIFAEHFRPAPEGAYSAVLERGDALVRWVTEPIGGEA